MQAAFGGGIFRGRRAPVDSVYDAVNALVNDERELFRRGGSAYLTTSNAANTLLGLISGETTQGQRTVFWDTAGYLYALAADGVTPYQLRIGDDADNNAQIEGSLIGPPVAISGMVVFRNNLITGPIFELLVYGGARKGFYSTGTVSTTAGSKTVTGSGTSWTANVEAGQMFRTGSQVPGVVASVDSNTSLTLREPWPTTAAGVTYMLQDVANVTYPSLDFKVPLTTPWVIGTVGAPARLLLGIGSRLYFTAPGSLEILFASLDFHELPEASLITGVSSIGDTAVVFTTTGVWAVSNMALDSFDDAGNVQHQVARISPDVILWGDTGISAYEGALIVPAIDDVFAFTLGAAPVPVSQGVRPLYREYVEAGYKPGIATVYRGHYQLPILDASNNVIDSLTCRLDLRDESGARRPAWTRQANGAAGRAYATRIGATTRTPKLLGLDGLRVSDLTGIFDPDAARKDDADGTDHALTIISNDVDTGPGLRGNTVLSANVEYELVDAASDNPTMTFATASGAEGAAFTTATALATGASTGPESDGTTPVAFDIRRKVERIRWRFQTTGAAASAILRRVELKIRQAGRQ